MNESGGPTIFHYVDNVCYFHLYPEPAWLNARMVDAFWFASTFSSCWRQRWRSFWFFMSPGFRPNMPDWSLLECPIVRSAVLT